MVSLHCAGISFAPQALKPAVRSYSSSTGGDISGSGNATSLEAAEQQQCADGGSVAAAATPLVPATAGREPQVNTAAGLLDQYLQQHSGLLPETSASATPLDTAMSALNNTGSSNYTARCSMEQPQDQACSEAPATLQQAAHQHGCARTRSAGIGRFCLADVESAAAQGLQIHNISVDFSLCSGTSSMSATSARQHPPAAPAQAACGQPPASSVRAGLSEDMCELFDEAGGSLAALDTILCCLETLAQAVLLR